MMHVFHKWSRWEQYKFEWTFTPCGTDYPAEVRGKQYVRSEDRQRRKCERCGKAQDEKVFGRFGKYE